MSNRARLRAAITQIVTTPIAVYLSLGLEPTFNVMTRLVLQCVRWRTIATC